VEYVRTDNGYERLFEYEWLEYSKDEDINDITNLVCDYHDEIDKFGDVEEKTELKSILKKYLDTGWETTEALGRKLSCLKPESLDELFDELDDLGAFDELTDDELEEGNYDLDEALKRKVIVRNGKRKRVKRSTKKGYTTRGGKEVRMSAKERRNRRKSQRKASRKRRAKKSQALRKRKKSMRKRRNVR